MSDLISRQAVEDITWEEPSYTDPLNVLTEVREKVRALPSVENKGEWIPVSERLPEKNRAVLTYVDTGMTKTYCLAYWKGEGWEEWIGYRMVESEMGYKVLAWQPLPEPYQKGGE